MVQKMSAALVAAIFTIATGAGIALAQDAAGAADQASPESPAETPAAETPAPAAAPEAGAETTQAAPAADGAGTAGTEAEADGTPQPGQSYVRETFGEWSMRCIKTEDDRDPCELYQLLRDADGGSVAEASVMAVEGPVAAIMTFVAPLETDLQQGLRLQIDSNEAMSYPFMVCASIGCMSRIGLNEEELNRFKRGNSVNVTLLPFGAPDDAAARLTMSLGGFTAGYNAVAEVMAELNRENGDDAAPATDSATDGAAAE